MRKARLLASGAAVLVAAAAVGCSSSSGGSSTGSKGTGSGSAKKTVTVGLLTDVSGAASSGNKTSVDGVKAGIVYAARNGYTVKYVTADTGTNPSNVSTAVQRLVTREKVDVVIAHSAIAFAGTSYLTSKGVPVVGAAEDGPEWVTAKNMFSVYGALHQTKVSTTYGEFFKKRGVTSLASLGYSVSPLSSEAAKAAAESAKHAGLKVGYLNAKFPFGSTDVKPIALAMKKARVDGFIASVDPNTSFALITALRQEGVDIKAALLPTGYGGDLLQAGPGALNAAQNVYFSLGYEPVEMKTAATQQFEADLRAAGVSGEPTFAMYNGYTSVGLIVRAMKAAGANPDQKSIIRALSGIHDWDAMGLFGGRKLDINDRENVIGGVDNCTWAVKLVGKTFEVTQGAAPICGTEIKGVTVSPSS